MPTDQVIALGRTTLQEVMILAGPILGLAVSVSLIINIVQVLTSLQEASLAAVPRLIASAAGIFFLMPWMWRHLCLFTIHMLSDFGAYLQ
jgi:flagellar biosynthesis protein FliQ